MIIGKKLARELNLVSAHSLYREDGKWYHHLRAFPGILFDKSGYVVFITKDEYLKHSLLQHAKDLHIIGGIKSIPTYTPFTEIQKNKISFLIE